jgi:arginyl-tRNA synthetase
LLDKASREGVKASIKNPTVDISVLEKNLYRFPEIIDRASFEYAPHYIATYLIELASIFNAFYANEKIVDKDDENSSYKVAITESFTIVMKNGLSVLGIKTPSRM